MRLIPSLLGDYARIRPDLHLSTNACLNPREQVRGLHRFAAPLKTRPTCDTNPGVSDTALASPRLQGASSNLPVTHGRSRPCETIAGVPDRSPRACGSGRDSADGSQHNAELCVCRRRAEATVCRLLWPHGS